MSEWRSISRTGLEAGCFTGLPRGLGSQRQGGRLFPRGVTRLERQILRESVRSLLRPRSAASTRTFSWITRYSARVPRGSNVTLPCAYTSSPTLNLLTPGPTTSTTPLMSRPACKIQNRVRTWSLSSHLKLGATWSAREPRDRSAPSACNNELARIR